MLFNILVAIIMIINLIAVIYFSWLLLKAKDLIQIRKLILRIAILFALTTISLVYLFVAGIKYLSTL